MADSTVDEAAEAHREALSESLRFSQMFSLVAGQVRRLATILAVALALIAVALSFWAARQLSRGFSRPIRDLVGWTDLIARDQPLPPPDPRGHRGVQEFALLRNAFRNMAGELEESRRDAIQSAKLRSWTEMARRVAHELKNPLTPMRMAALTIDRMESTVAQEASAVLLEEIARLDEMARAFSQFGRMPEGPPSEVDLGELLEDLVSQHRPIHPSEKGDTARVSLRVASPLPRVLGHYEALVRCFRNLLLNAMEAAGPGGSVEIRAEPTEGGIRVEITDSGPGIPPENLDRIWDPEFTTRNGGTGLGLPMVLQTIQLHHGRIQGGNRPEGGAVFLVYLPTGGTRGGAGPGARSGRGAPLPKGP
jgi:signal transduction histidine kinase